MDHIFIVCVDDQPEVLNSLLKDLAELETLLDIEECESVDEAWEVFDSIDADGNHLSIVITDQVMPKRTGVDLLKKLNADPRFTHTKTILLTGLATHEDTIEAINIGKLDYYLEKPWKKENLHKVIKTLISRYIFEKGIDHEPYKSILDQEVLLEHFRKST